MRSVEHCLLQSAFRIFNYLWELEGVKDIFLPTYDILPVGKGKCLVEVIVGASSLGSIAHEVKDEFYRQLFLFEEKRNENSKGIFVSFLFKQK